MQNQGLQSPLPIPNEKNPFQFYNHIGRQIEQQQEKKSWRVKLKDYVKKSGKLFAVKPLLVLYMMAYAVTESVGTQLWIDRVCRVNMNYSKSVCDDITSDINSEANDAVQAEVNTYQLYSSYMADIPQGLISLYLGPMSDFGRKPLMVFPFFGHIISGTCMILNSIYVWDARYLWLEKLYVFFGGYSLLSIAMYGYIGDVTSPKERTVMIAILGALGFIMMPLADFCGGQIYKVGGFLAVYITSMGFVFAGIFYIWFIPESIVVKKSQTEKEEMQKVGSKKLFTRFRKFFHKTNNTLLETFKYVFSKREHGERGIILSMLSLSFIGSLRSRGTNGLLFTQKKFGWTVTDYTNYKSFWVIHISIKGFIVMPFLCYYLQVHDCIISILGNISGVEEYLVWAFATKGWHMYFASALSSLSGSRGVPQTSILSKCVPSHQLGKIFALFGAFQTLLGMGMSYLNTMLYNATLDSFLGASYCLSAGFEVLNMVGMAVVYWHINRIENKFGPLGYSNDDKKQ